MKESIAVESDDKRIFALSKAEHQCKIKRKITMAEFFSLILKKWRGLP